VHCRSNGFAAAFHFLYPRLADKILKLRLDHGHPGLEGRASLSPCAVCAAVWAMSNPSESQQFLNKVQARVLGGLRALPGAAFLEIIKIRRGAEQPLPIFPARRPRGVYSSSICSGV